MELFEPFRRAFRRGEAEPEEEAIVEEEEEIPELPSATGAPGRLTSGEAAPAEKRKSE